MNYLIHNPYHLILQHDPSQRVALRDLAVYLGNAHLSAHNTHVRVLTDMEYRAGGYARENPYGLLHNLVLVGGPAVNKVMIACPLDRTDNTPLDLIHTLGIFTIPPC